MKKLLLISLVLFVSCSDSSKENNSASASEPSVMLNELLKHKKDFRYQNLQGFEIDTFNWVSRKGQYKQLDSALYQLLWKGERSYDMSSDNRDYLYSWQSRDSNFMEFTILSQLESDYCDVLYYFILDRNARVVDKFSVAARCGDGGWTYTERSRFTGRSILKRTSVESDYGSDEEKLVTRDTDSLETLISIDSLGKTSEKDIFKATYTDTVEIQEPQ